MATMISEVYDALKEAGASEEKSRAAAEELAKTQEVLVGLRGDMAALKSDVAAVKWTLVLIVTVMTAGFGLGIGILWNIMQRLPGVAS